MSTIKNYIFVPWVRQGVAKQISTVDNFGDSSTGELHRASIESSLTWNTTHTETKTIGVVGPADIQSISEEAILNIEPKHRIDDFEANYLPFIEFYDEDFPWRFSPLKHSGEKLRPWIALVVLKDTEYTLSTPKGKLPYFSLKSGVNFSTVFHKVEDHFAWAHVQFNPLDNSNFDGGTGSSTAENIDLIKAKIKEDPDLAFSRLMCPRNLERDTAYTAFLIPAFETGRLAGLGRDASTTPIQQASWLDQDPTSSFDINIKDFPIYKRWTFETSAMGDFENLVKALVPRQVDATKGSRPMDLQETGFNIEPTYSISIGLEGALKPPTFEHAEWPAENVDPDDGSVLSSDTGYITNLRNVINLDVDLSEDVLDPLPISTSPFGSGAVSIHDDPIVTPPKYGQWHKKQKSLLEITNEDKTWFEDINLNPGYRAVASLGTKVVQDNQESYMERAWNQLGEVELANQKIRQAELAKWVTESLVRKNIKSASESRLLNLTSPVISKIKEAGVPITKHIKESVVPNATVDSGFRKVMRSGSKPIKKSVGTSTASAIFPDPVLSFDTVLSTTPTTTAKDYTLNTELTTTPENIDLSDLPPDYSNYVTTNLNAFLDDITEPESLDPIASSINSIKEKINTRIDPLQATSAHAQKLASGLRVLNAGGTLDAYTHQKPIMAHPSFKDSMYEELKKLDQEFLIPNLDAFPNNTVTLLETNQKFIEAYFTGLNHEMSRELLWREYPTDQRGTYFKHFWDKSDSDNNTADIGSIDDWDYGLGQNPVDPDATEGFIVLFVRGDLFKKFPDTLVYAQKAAEPITDTYGNLLARDFETTGSDIQKRPLFRIDLEPDITVIGFDLIESEVRTGTGSQNQGWYFVFAERPGKPRFGLDDNSSSEESEETPPSPPSPDTWSDLYWQHLTGDNPPHLHVSENSSNSTITDLDESDPLPTWGNSSADMASITYQKPVIVGVHADRMLPDA